VFRIGRASDFFYLAAEAHGRAVPFLRIGVSTVNLLEHGVIDVHAERRFNLSFAKTASAFDRRDILAKLRFAYSDRVELMYRSR